VALLVTAPAFAGSGKQVCPAVPRPGPEPLDWSDGQYRMCSPRSTEEGKPYPADVEMICVVIIDAVRVASRRVGPGELMTGKHHRTGTGIATGMCETLEGQRSRFADPLEVKLSSAR
jgi:hypothetical protein